MCEIKVKYRKAHYRRKRLIEENLLQYMAYIKTSDRNKQIVKAYAEGAGYQELAELYGVCADRIPQIVTTYIRHCSLYKKRERFYKAVEPLE